jgi:hypothetical protein
MSDKIKDINLSPPGSFAAISRQFPDKLIYLVDKTHANPDVNNQRTNELYDSNALGMKERFRICSEQVHTMIAAKVKRFILVGNNMIVLARIDQHVAYGIYIKRI